MRIALGTFGLDVADLILQRFKEEKKLQNKRHQNRGAYGSYLWNAEKERDEWKRLTVTMLPRARGKRNGQNNGMSLKLAQRVKLYLDVDLKEVK